MLKTIHNLQSQYQPNFDLEKAFLFLLEKGKENYGQNFKLLPEDSFIIFKLITYALKDYQTALKLNINLDKGIMLTGPVGCGKTSLMTLIREFQSKDSKHVIKTARGTTYEFIKHGYDIIERYSNKSYRIDHHQNIPSEPITYCFDDLGTEQNIKYYGNECNVLAEILLNRYDLFIQDKMITHITTNLTASEIEQYYGNRLRSRMREMFNLIAFSSETLDKRK